jgi:phage-related protein
MAARPNCVGVKATGDVCDKHAIVGGVRCTTHLRTIHNNGPNATEIKERGYQHKKELAVLSAMWRVRIDNEQDEQRQRDLTHDFNHEYSTVKLRHRHEIEIIQRGHRDRIRETGVDPDAEANQRRRDAENRRREEWRQALRGDEEEFNRLQDVLLRAAQDRRVRAAPPVGELQQFATDNQNIHRERTVNVTKEMVSLILTIPVPDEYKWSGSECSKTPGDIVMTCHLTPKAAWQMFSKYCQDESIYELGKGIYGKVLDGVWQYILSSSDKTDLCRVLKQEMEDNVGMCAQGNLSRLCNILAGYLDGIGSQESITDILGRLLPKLMEIENVESRLAEAFKILKENKVPFSHWKAWADALLYDQELDTTVGFLYNDQQEITGIIAVVG